jgi:hypothetical protein
VRIDHVHGKPVGWRMPFRGSIEIHTQIVFSAGTVVRCPL